MFGVCDRYDRIICHHLLVMEKRPTVMVFISTDTGVAPSSSLQMPRKGDRMQQSNIASNISCIHMHWRRDRMQHLTVVPPIMSCDFKQLAVSEIRLLSLPAKRAADFKTSPTLRGNHKSMDEN